MKIGAPLFALLSLLLLGAWPGLAREGVYGSLKFESSLHDFGDVYRGQEVSHLFKFTNQGPGPLTIQGVHAACGCTAVEVERGKKYQPGESGFVEVKLDTKDFMGAVVKTVTVLSNEKLLPDRLLTLRAQVKSDVEADPPLVDFGDTYSRDGASRIVRVKPIGGFKLDVRDLVYNREVMDASFVREGAEFVVTVRLKPGLTPRFVKETIVVLNNSTHLRELPLPVRANLKGSIDFAPAYLEFGAIGPTEVARRSLTMKGLAPFDLKGTRVELIVNGRRLDNSGQLISVNAVPHEKDKKLVSVELKNKAGVAGSVHGKLFLQTTDREQGELAVDFYAFFR